MSTDSRTETARTLDDLRAVAGAGIAAYEHMVEIGHGVGGLPEREFAATLAYDDTFHADVPTVLSLIDGLLAVRRFAETRERQAWVEGKDQQPWIDLLRLIEQSTSPETTDGGDRS